MTAMEPETEHTIPAERPEEIRELEPGDPVFSLTAMIFLRCTTCDGSVIRELCPKALTDRSLAAP